MREFWPTLAFIISFFLIGFVIGVALGTDRGVEIERDKNSNRIIELHQKIDKVIESLQASNN